jgi:glyoxylase-like metal-dependent hydrolase (beta-lactamase superfamily II)
MGNCTMLVAPGVHHLKIHSRTLKPARYTNVYLIGDKEVIIIDGGYSEDAELEKLFQLLKKLGDPRVVMNVISHRHKDHYNRTDIVSDRTGARLAAHREDIGSVNDGLNGLHADLKLKDGEELEADGKKIRVMHLPGHTPGMLNFYLEEDGLLFTSDNVVGFGTTWIGPPDGDMTLYLNSLRTLLALNSVKICPGHGPIIERPAEKIEEIIDHRLKREEQLLSLIGEGFSTSEELFRKVYVKGEKIHSSLNTVARRTIEGHLAKLQKEGKIVADEDGRIELCSAV